MKVRVKKLQTGVYELLECPKHIDMEVWGYSLIIGEPSGSTKYFHHAWMDRLKEVCNENNVELVEETQ